MRELHWKGRAGYIYQDQSSVAAVPGRDRLAEPDTGWCDLWGKHQGSSEAEVSLLLQISWGYEWQGQHHSTIHNIVHQATGDHILWGKWKWVDHKPVAVDTLSIKQTVEDIAILKKKPRASPNSFLSELTELSQLKKDQRNHDTRFKDKQCNIEELKLNLLEKESDIRMELLQVEAEHKRLHFKWTYYVNTCSCLRKVWRRKT